MRRPLRVLVPAVLLATGLGLAAPPPASAAATCTFTQITHGGGGSLSGAAAPSISANGRYVAFLSTGLYGGSNPDHNAEVFRYDLDGHFFVQVTNTTGLGANRETAIDGTGGRIAFTSSANIGGQNPDGSRDLFRWSARSLTVPKMLTFTTPPDAVNGLSVSDDGTRVVFTEDHGGSSDVEIHYLGDPVPTSITLGSVGTNDWASISGDGETVVLRSTSAFSGGPTPVEADLFTVHLGDGARARVTRGQAGDHVGDPAVSDGGQRVAYVSHATVGSRNTDRSAEVQLSELSAGTRQVPVDTTADDEGVEELAMNAAGTRVAFVSDADPVGVNDDGTRELYLQDFGGSGGRTTQVTPEGTTYNGQVDTDASGRLVVFVSTGDFVGENTDRGAEVFLATCSAPPAPTVCNGQLVTVDRNRGQRPTALTDVIRGTNGADRIDGRAGGDRFCGLAGADTFNGGPGADRAFGGGADDRLRGGAGRDRLDGGPGPDTCDGGPGQDTAVRCSTRIGVP
jgi:Tol biopolymer transport system component